MSAHTSQGFFDLAAEFEIPVSLGEQAPMSDERYLAFCEAYGRWADQRDVALKQYLELTPSLLRTLIPSSHDPFLLANQVIWYLDEVLIRDPVMALIRAFPEPSQEGAKHGLFDAVQQVAFHWPAIERGYVLLYGAPLSGDMVAELGDEVDRLLEIPAVLHALEAETRFGYEERDNQDGLKFAMYHIQHYSGGPFGMHCLDSFSIPPGEGLFYPVVRLFEPLHLVTRDELAELIGEARVNTDDMYRKSIRWALSSVLAAHQAQAAVLFPNNAAAEIVKHAAIDVDRPKQRATVEVLNVALPFLRGVSPDRLIGLREDLPSAFRDFRASLHDIVVRGRKEGVVGASELTADVETMVAPALARLEHELTASAKRSRIIGYGGPGLAVLGGLCGMVLGLPPAGMLTGVLAGLGVAVGAAADSAATQEKAKAHPFYFLWRATR